MRSRVPAPGALSICTNPPCCFTRPYTVARPSPVPFPTGFVVKNGSKARCRVASSIPSPVSSTARHTNSDADPGPSTSRCASLIQLQLVSSRSTPPSGIASRALFTRFSRICSIACPSAETSGRSSSANTSSSMSAGRTRRSTAERSFSKCPRCSDSSVRLERRAKPSSLLTINRPLTAADWMSRRLASSGPRASSSAFQDDRQQVVEVVRDAAGELADRFHLLGLPQLLFEALPLAHIFGEDFVTLHAAVFMPHRTAVQPHRNGLTIVASPVRLRLHGASRVIHLREITRAGPGVLEHVTIEMPAQQLRLGLAGQHLDEGGIHGQQGAIGRGPEDSKRRLLHQRPAGGVGAPQRFFGAAPLGDVGRHPHDTGDAAVPLSKR